MVGWALFAAAAAATLAGLWRSGFPLPLRNAVLAAVALAAAGYAWQLPPASVGRAAPPSPPLVTAIDPETLELRNAMLGRFGDTAAYFVTSDALMRFGAPGAAAQFVQGGIRREPRNAALWTQLGIIIATRDRAVSPAAAFAFRRAMAVAPAEPAPVFFLGLAHVRAGKFDLARAAWVRALVLTPAHFPYRNAIVTRLAVLDELLANSRN